MNTPSKFLVIISTLVIATTPAIASHRQKPSTNVDHLIGSWCAANGESSYSPGKDCSSDGTITFYPSSYEGWEQSCRITSVKTTTSNKTMGDKVSNIFANCNGEGCTWKEQITVHVTKGTLVVENKRDNRERCPAE
jgi:hypothetical protein